MKLSDSQQVILAKLQEATKSLSQREVAYCSEWLGYLPFGAYHWIEVGGEDISKDFPAGWQRADLQCLEQAGFLRKLSEWQDPNDEYHSKATYAVA
jgi:hypothetical protein